MRTEVEFPDAKAMIAVPVTRRCTDSHAADSGTRNDRNLDTFDTG
jgi:hypothetical protein